MMDKTKRFGEVGYEANWAGELGLMMDPRGREEDAIARLKELRADMAARCTVAPVVHGEGKDIRVTPYPRGVIDLFWGDGLVKLIGDVVIARGDEIIDPEDRKKVLLAWARAAAFEYLRHGQEIPLEDFLAGERC